MKALIKTVLLVFTCVSFCFSQSLEKRKEILELSNVDPAWHNSKSVYYENQEQHLKKLQNKYGATRQLKDGSIEVLIDEKNGSPVWEKARTNDFD